MTYKVVMDAALHGDVAAGRQFAAVIQRCARVGAGKAGAAEFAEDVGQELWLFAHQHANRFDPQYELEPYLIRTAFKMAQALRRRNLSLGTAGTDADDDDGPREREIPAGMDGEPQADPLSADADTVDQVDRTAAMNYLLRISPELRGVNDGSITMSEPNRHHKAGPANAPPSDDVTAMRAMVNQQSQSIEALTRMFAQLMQSQTQPQPAAPSAAVSVPAGTGVAKPAAADEAPAESAPATDASARLVSAGDAAAEDAEGAALPAEEPALTPARKYGRASSEDAALLKTLRQAAGLTQVEMAERLGLKVPTYQSYEYGRSNVPKQVKEGAQKVSVTPEYSFIRSRYIDKTMSQIARSWCERLMIDPPSPTALGRMLMVDKGTASRWLDRAITVKMTPPELLLYEHRVQAEEEFLKVAAERHGTDVVREGLRRILAREEDRQQQIEHEAVRREIETLAAKNKRKP